MNRLFICSNGGFRPATLTDLFHAHVPSQPNATSTPATPTPKAKFKPGDVVTLNSGSPDMTVVDETNGEVRVVYFPETDTAAYACEPRQVIFPAVCLSAIPNDEAMN